MKKESYKFPIFSGTIIFILFSILFSSEALSQPVNRRLQPAKIEPIKTERLQPLQPFKLQPNIYYDIEKVKVDINISAETTNVAVEYDIKNLKEDTTKLDLKIIQPMSLYQPEQLFLKNVSFDVLEKRTIPVSFKIPTLDENIKSILVIPTVALNNSVYFDKVKEYFLTITFPNSAKKLLYTSHTLQPKNSDGDWHTSEWIGRNVYVIPFSAKWTDLDVDVDIEKKMSRIVSNRAIITIKVTNNKSEVLKGLKLEDSFTPEQIRPIRPEAEFTTYEGDDSEPRIFWTKTIEELQPGETQTFQYTVQFRMPVRYLTRTVGLLNSDIVAISNDITIDQSLYGNFGGPLGPVGPDVDACVVPAGWDLDYKKKDHHINEHSIRIGSQSFSKTDSKLTWTTHLSYCDRNKKDDYRWSVSHTVLRLEDAFMYSGSTGWISCDGGTSYHNNRYSSEALKGYSNATVLLRGWYFDYTKKDHHIKTIKIQLRDITYNSNTGTIEWKAEANYRDRNAKDDYKWKYWYQIIAFNNGNVHYTQAGGTDDGHNAIHNGSYLHSSLKGYQNAVVIPLGWQFRFSKKDHHINENSFHISNVEYNPNNGKITWQAHLNYSDRNFKDDYNWDYYVAILAFNRGEGRTYDAGPYIDDGGAASKNFILDLNHFFEPITWYNGVMDGTEEGIDCGGRSPIKCIECLKPTINEGNASSAHLYSLRNGAVLATANWALLEYADTLGVDPNSFYSGVETADRYVDAIAWFVTKHMGAKRDGGSWKGPQSAARTINSSGSRCSEYFCGDCEDFSILRAALLRSLGFDWKCIFSADHIDSENQGQCDECQSCTKRKSGGHTYNIVYYKGRYRILDFGKMTIRLYSSCYDQHSTDNIWNDHYGKHSVKRNKRPFDGKLLMNYPGNPICPSANWNWRSYYGDICR